MPACRVFCAKQITVEKIMLGYAHLLQFCKRTEHIFGKEAVTPNMHLHCHLRECIMDYGPLHGFWLYAFERYNGILGAMPNNNHSIEVQIMQRFLRDTQTLTVLFPDQFCDEFQPLFPRHMQISSSLGESMTCNCYVDLPLQTSEWSIGSPGVNVGLPKYCSRQVFDSTQAGHLTELYTGLYNVSRSDLVVSTCHMKFSSATVNGKLLGTHKSRTKSSSIAIATWNKDLFGLTNVPGSTAGKNVHRAVRINYFCQHNVLLDGQNKTHLLVAVSWFKCHPKCHEFGKPLTVWYYDLFEACGIHSIIPVQFIHCRTISLIDKLDGESVLFVCPCIDY